MNYDFITTESHLRDFCAEFAGCDWIALDTEFISEGSYRPELCLIQVSTPKHLAVIDAIEVTDVLPFWQVVVDGEQETIVHAGRSEMRILPWPPPIGCQKTLSRRLQLAGRAGRHRISGSGYSTLVSKLLGESMDKHETRTDWRKRPLSKRQLDYAAEDVYYLSHVRDRIHARLVELGRLGWLEGGAAVVV